MKRTLAACLAALICLSLATAGLCEGGLPIDGIAWDSTIDEVRAHLNGDVDALTESLGDYGEFAMLARDDTTCLGLACQRLIFTFYDGELYAVYGYFTSESLDGSAQTLVDALSALYGTPNYRDPDGLSLSDLINQSTGAALDSGLLCSWDPGEDMTAEIYLLAGGNDAANEVKEPYLCGFTITNMPVAERFEDAMEGYLDAED